jgi:hypothetical protein
MSIFSRSDATPRAILRIDDRFQVEIRRQPPPPMTSAHLVIRVYPITDGEIWEEPYEVFAVDEGRLIELENDLREK